MGKETKEKDHSWKATMLRLDKEYGKGTVMSCEEKVSGDYNAVTSGSIGMDVALGVGGWVPGKTYELMGWEGTGKTTICGHATSEFQKKFPGRRVVYIDAEHALDKAYFQKLGVNTENMYVSQPRNGEEGYNVAENLILTGEVSLCIIDSDTILRPQIEMEGDVGDSSLGKKARMNNQAIPKLKLAGEMQKTCIIIISQFREKIGVMFGSPITTTGGNALKFYADCRMEISKFVAKDKDKVAYGNTTTVKVTKNKMAPPFRTAQFDILFGEGIDKIGEILKLAVEFEIVEKSGAWFAYQGSKLGHGEVAAKEILRDNPDLAEDFRKQIMEKLTDSPKIEIEDDTTVEKEPEPTLV